MLPLDTLLAVAERRASRPAPPAGPLDAHGRVYHAATLVADHGWQTLAEPAVCAPSAAGAAARGGAGRQRHGVHGERLPPAALPQARPARRQALTLAPAGLTAGRAVPADQALPLYIRDKVAQTTAERAAARSAPAQTP